MADRRLVLPTSGAQVTLKFLQDGQPMENVMYVKHQHSPDSGVTWSDADFDGGAADTVNTDLATWYSAQMAPFVAENITATGADVVWNTSVGAGPLEGRTYSGSPWPIAPAGGNPALPNSCTIAVSLRTAILGRSFHGRVFLCGLGRNSVDPTAPNSVQPSDATQIITAFTDLVNAWKANHGAGLILDRFPMQVASFRHAGADRSPAMLTDVDHVTLSDLSIDNQRRRLPFHNRHG